MFDPIAAIGEFITAAQRNQFLQYGLLAGLLASVSCGIVGSYVVVRRITSIAGGIAHCVLGGMGAAWYLHAQHGWTWLHPLHGALAAALTAALIIGWVSLRAREREDTVISALWAVGMAIGVLFIAKTPSYGTDLYAYLFGDILLVTPRELWLLALLDGAILLIGLSLYKQFLAICFDEEFARLRGLNVEFYYLLLLCLIALTVVVLIMIVGIVLVIALLTLPVAIAGYFTRSLWQTMLAATTLTILFTTSGIALSYGPNLPAGATTIVLAGAAYLLVAAGAAGARALRAGRGSQAHPGA